MKNRKYFLTSITSIMILILCTGWTKTKPINPKIKGLEWTLELVFMLIIIVAIVLLIVSIIKLKNKKK